MYEYVSQNPLNRRVQTRANAGAGGASRGKKGSNKMTSNFMSLRSTAAAPEYCTQIEKYECE